MEVFINNEPVSFTEGSAFLSELLEQQHFLNKKGIAVAVNNTVIPRAHWPHHALQAEDKITIIRATQGG